MTVRLYCQHCGELIVVEPGAVLDTGSVFTCRTCRKETVIELWRPEEREVGDESFRYGGEQR
jgi:hypothetical protein